MSNPLDSLSEAQTGSEADRKPPTVRAAMVLAKSQAYQDAADAPATLRAYAADLANYKAWWRRSGLVLLSQKVATELPEVLVD